MSPSKDAKEAARETEIISCMQEIDALIKRLHEATASLSERLSPILREEPPTPPLRTAPAPVSVRQTPLGRRLAEQHSQLQHCFDILDDKLNRMEL
jgi:hypothetical protein